MRRLLVLLPVAAILSIGCGSPEALIADGEPASVAFETVGGVRSVPPGTSAQRVSCPSAKRSVSGAFRGADETTIIRASYPGDVSSEPAVWIFEITNKNTSSVSLTLYAICALP